MEAKTIHSDVKSVPIEQYALNELDRTDLEGKTENVASEAGGVAVIEASQAVFGKYGIYLMWLG